MSDCSILCCGPSNSSATATRTSNPSILPLDGCKNQTEYFAVAGDYLFGTPVKPTGNAGEVEPSLDGTDAIGVAVCNVTGAAAGDKVVVARTGHIFWPEIAANLGEDPTDQDAWWALHVELAKINIYVRFTL